MSNLSLTTGLAIGDLLHPNPAMGEKRYQALDGMRGLCALFVATFHFDMLLGTGYLLNHGWLSVDIFFVLSGFVISNAYEDKLNNGLGSGSFLWARFKRLTPTGWMGTLMCALSVSALYFSGKMAAIPNMTYAAILTATLFAFLLLPISISPVAKTFGYMAPENFPINTPLWSLQGEWLINIAYANLLYTLRVSALLLIYMGPAVYLATHSLEGMWAGIIPALCRATVGFIAGIIIYRLHHMKMLQILPAIAPKITYAVWFFICAVPAKGSMPFFQTASALAIAPLLVAMLVRAERPMPKPLLWLGAMSYPLYASHLTIMNMAILLLPNTKHHNMLWILPMLAGALLLAAGIDRIARMIPSRRTQLATSTI